MGSRAEASRRNQMSPNSQLLDERKRLLRAKVRTEAEGLEPGEEMDLLWAIIDGLMELVEDLRDRQANR